jgi:hypothetical protein
MLERLCRIAEKHHPPSAKRFIAAMEYERQLRGRQRRMRAIGDPGNLDKAADELTAAYFDYQWMMQGIQQNCDPQLTLVGHAGKLGERLLQLADLILVEKRKTIE